MNCHVPRRPGQISHSQRLVAALALAMLAAIGCGGGGGGQGGTDTDPGPGPDPGGRNDEVATGSFASGPISGLSYESPSYSGVTDSEGKFRYAEGEILVFGIGGTELGRSVGKPTLTLFDLVPEAEIAIDSDAVRAGVYERSPFAEVINIAVLLQTLDEDGDPENGIEISEPVAKALESVALDLKQKSKRFMWDPAFRSVLADINDQSLLDTPGIVRSPDLAIQHVYRVLDVEPEIFAWGLREKDSDADGTIDSRAVYTFDEWGHRVRSEHDSDADGVADSISYERWNDDGRLAAYEYDDDANGAIESVSRHIHDELGNEVRREDGDALGNLSSVVVQEFDRLGRMLRRERDSDADGKADSVTTYVYQASTTRRFVDANADGVVDQVYETERDASGNAIRSEQDRNADGNPDYIQRSTYDAHDHLLVRTVDDDGDGDVDTSETNTYDEEGRLSRKEEDLNGNGAPDRITEHLYEDGSLVRINTYQGDSDTPYLETVYIRNEEGHLVQLQTYRDGVLTSNQVNQVDENGRATRRDRDTDGDGVTDEIAFLESVKVGFAWEFDF